MRKMTCVQFSDNIFKTQLKVYRDLTNSLRSSYYSFSDISMKMLFSPFPSSFFGSQSLTDESSVEEEQWKARVSLLKSLEC